MKRNHSLSLILGASALLVLAASPASAADPSKEISTAATHASLAAGSSDLKMVHTHLQHVINCLVGPGGAGFDAAPGNPCKDQGAGAIPDAPPAKQKELQAAVGMAKTGLGQSDVAKAKQEAGEIQAALSKAAM